MQRSRRWPKAVRRALAALALAAALPLVAAECPGPRSIIFPAPAPRAVEPPAGARLVEVAYGDGLTAYALHRPAAPGAPTIVHFHGNAEQLSGQAWLVSALGARGVGVYAVEYPGYGPAEAAGPPTEDKLYAAAEAALIHLRDALGVPAAKTTLMGWSLGTGVASEMAKRGHGAHLVLLAPYTSIADLAEMRASSAGRALIKDTFDTAARAPSIDLPVLIVHGTRDPVIPIEMGRDLAERFPRAELIELPGAGHNAWRAGGDALLDRIAAFARGRAPTLH